ncbi:hypothetical protein SDC9_143786 [bioreactor metagenome]|uniref:Uncharacterized protein n=1 Tax=bioreactor metagenome TaxID=1076179 RepID=A0A645E4W4_9ZZZZ
MPCDAELAAVQAGRSDLHHLAFRQTQAGTRVDVAYREVGLDRRRCIGEHCDKIGQKAIGSQRAFDEGAAGFRGGFGGLQWKAGHGD